MNLFDEGNGQLEDYYVEHATDCVSGLANKQQLSNEVIQKRYPHNFENLTKKSEPLRPLIKMIRADDIVTFEYTYDLQGREVKRIGTDGTIRVTKYIEDFLVIAYSNKQGKWSTRIEGVDGSLISIKMDCDYPVQMFKLK